MTTTFGLPGQVGSRMVPASWILLWELPFWVLFLVSAFVPATLVPRQEWFGIPMKLTDVFTVLGACLYSCGFLGRLLRRQTSPVAGSLLVATVLLGIYGFGRLVSGPLELEDQLAMGFALALALSAPLQAAGILAVFNFEERRQFLNRFVFVLACVSVVYTSESILGLGLRSEASVNLNSDFGIQRVRGPLFGSSTGYFLLLPALGWAVQSFFDPLVRRSFSIFTTVALLAAYLGLGSRAGLILLVVYVALLPFFLRQLKSSATTAILLLVTCLASGALIYTQADTQRLTQLEDTHRRLTHEMALNLAQSESLPSLMAGQGYGSIWPWYRRDTLRADYVAIGDNTISTGFGPSLYHSHSTILELLVEFGLPGLGWLAFLGVSICSLPLRGSASASSRIFALALAVSLLSLGFDLFLFKEVRVNAVWWLFAISAFQFQQSNRVSSS